MEQHTNTAAIEISDTSIKFIVGYCINKMPVIVYHDSRPLKEGAVVDGYVVRPDDVVEVIKDFLNLPDDSIRAKVNGMCSLVIPGIGYRYLAIEPTTYISHYDEGITTADIQNLIGIVASQEVPPEVKVVDIVPKIFKTDKGVSVEPPYGVVSRKVAAEMSVHTVHTDMYVGHRTTVEKAGFRIDLSAVSSYAAAYLISNTYAKQDLNQYFYVDMGAKITTVTIIGHKFVPYEIRTFNKRGGDDLTQSIASRFKINFHEAEKLKLRYGYDPKVRTYELPIFEGTNMEGIQITLWQRDLNKVIDEFFDSLVKNIVNCMELALKESKAIPQNFPVFIGGGASKLMGIEYLLEKMKPNCQSCQIFIPNVAGARDQGLISLLGLISLNGRNQEHVDNSYRGMSTLTRQ